MGVRLFLFAIYKQTNTYCNKNYTTAKAFAIKPGVVITLNTFNNDPYLFNQYPCTEGYTYNSAYQVGDIHILLHHSA
jgi:hypothetical protein